MMPSMPFWLVWPAFDSRFDTVWVSVCGSLNSSL